MKLIVDKYSTAQYSTRILNYERIVIMKFSNKVVLFVTCVVLIAGIAVPATNASATEISAYGHSVEMLDIMPLTFNYGVYTGSKLPNICWERMEELGAVSLRLTRQQVYLVFPDIGMGMSVSGISLDNKLIYLRVQPQESYLMKESGTVFISIGEMALTRYIGGVIGDTMVSDVYGVDVHAYFVDGALFYPGRYFGDAWFYLNGLRYNVSVNGSDAAEVIVRLTGVVNILILNEPDLGEIGIYGCFFATLH